MNGNFKLKNKKRFYIALLLLSFVISTPVFASTVYESKEPAYQTVIVKEGDNLWNIVSEFSKGTDVRKYIYDVKKLNKMNDNNIYPGQTILIPLR